MNTFLPFPDFRKSAERILESGPEHNKLLRLSKQIAEAGQMHRALLKMEQSFVAGHGGHHNYAGKYAGKKFGYMPIAWSKHPAVLMWYGNRSALLEYTRACEKVRRKYRPSANQHIELRLMELQQKHNPGLLRHRCTELHLLRCTELHTSHQLVLDAKQLGTPRDQYQEHYYWPGPSPQLEFDYAVFRKSQ